MSDERRVSLDDKDFNTLIRWGVVEQDWVKIILKDIWLHYMYMMVTTFILENQQQHEEDNVKI